MSNLDLTADVIDVRDIIERFEELETERNELEDNDQGNAFPADDKEEFETLEAILNDIRGMGGDEQWNGDWYPVALIRETYFTEYAEELIKDCEGLPRDIPSYLEIDWEATAKNISVDYSVVEIEGTDYLYR